ncbi:carotenoid oxygenase [Mucor mucedo]|uniref:carotenoid oxygenase n=1 Tax=Mucor mucedo TaxID=29922 RepID=UPI00221FE036|nr:carotenoid oxygenase [Mucor mucedo]KAI7893570.1 carotenoid oxygenase [Mucor mucedo]
MIFVALAASPILYVIYNLYSKYNNVYKKYQDVFSGYEMKDTPETEDPITLQLTSGSFPSWLNGIMYRVGPGKFNIKQDDGSTLVIKHAFDGLSFMHRFRIDGTTQTLKYNSRCLAKSLEKALAQNSFKGLIFFGFIPVLSFSRWLYHFWARLDQYVLRPRSRASNKADGHNVGVTVTPNFPLPSKWEKNNQSVLVSKTDANILQKIHAETLVPEKVFTYTTYDAKLKGQLSAAHHQSDPDTKEIFNFTLSYNPKPRLIVFSTSEAGKVTVLADFTQRTDKSNFQAPYIHSFWLTKNYVIIPESPLIYKDKGINMLLNGNIISSMTWEKNSPTYFHVISRNGDGLVASIPGPAFFTFHVSNAFETADPATGDIILTLDCASFSDGNIVNQVHKFGASHYKGPDYTPKPSSEFNGTTYPPPRHVDFGDLNRYKLNLTQSKHISTDLMCKNLEFPRINQSFAGNANYRFVYGCELLGFTEKRDETNRIVKVDIDTGAITYYGDEGFYCSEPIFVPNPEGTREDDGVLLSLVNNFDCCYLIILDATTLTELARFKIGQFTAVTFHGSYVDHEFESININ